MNKIWIVLLISLLPFTGYSQNDTGKTPKNKHKKTKKATMLPSWATAHNYDGSAHVYFPDYYSYYDPKRGGYAYWDNGKWEFSQSIPPYLGKVDLSKSRVQILKGLSLDLHPELNYPYYMELYPADNDHNLVPVPIPGNPAH
jgi:hypothetical protein